MERGTCPNCGNEIPSGSPFGDCPVCLLGVGSEDVETIPIEAGATLPPEPDDLGNIGPYRLIEILGEGGMGTVFRAIQDEPIRREVALKVIKAGMDTREVIRRFEGERQALAMMKHPGIARVLDAGETDEGRPYFVMELVKGLHLTRFCDENRLGTRERLDLFLEVCRAVQHAHQNGIIHRDLKPGNILVTRDESGMTRAMVIDFGIAKAVGEDGEDRSFVTMAGQVLGTPQYMSPEQAGAGLVDTRTDIYALGVILYELLTNTTPLRPETVKQAAIDEILRLVREMDAEKPSKRMGELEEDTRTKTAARRGETAEQWRREISGDLEWVVLKALEKDAARRYGSAEAFLGDIERYLSDEPIEARPPSRLYKLGKFAKRNRLLVGASASVALALIVATIVSIFWAIEADEARKLAEARLAQADAVPEFLFNAFRQPDPTVGGADLRAVDVLDRAAIEAEVEFRDQPHMRGRILESIGRTFRGLGFYERANELFRRASEAVGSADGDSETTGRLLLLRSETHRLNADFVKAAEVSAEDWKRLAQEKGQGSYEALRARFEHCLNLLELGEFDTVEKLVSEVLENEDAFPEARRVDFGSLEAQLAEARGDYETYYRWFEERLVQFFSQPDSSTDINWTLIYLTRGAIHLKQYHEAIAACELRLGYCRERVGVGHQFTLQALTHLAHLYLAQGHTESARLVILLALEEEGSIPLKENTRAGLSSFLEKIEPIGPSNQVFRNWISSGDYPLASASIAELDTKRKSTIWYWKSEFAFAAGDLEAGREAGMRALEKNDSEFGGTDVYRQRRNSLVRNLVEAGDLDRARELVDEAWKDEENEDWLVHDFLRSTRELAEAYWDHQDYEACAQLARRYFGKQREMQKPLTGALTWAYRKLRKPLQIPNNSERLLEFEREMITAFSETLGFEHPVTMTYRHREIEILTHMGKGEEAIALLQEYFASGDDNQIRLVSFRATQCRALILMGRFEEAKTKLDEAWRDGFEYLEGDEENSKGMKPILIKVIRTRILLYQRMGDEEKKEEWQRELQRWESDDAKHG